jgi:hypothetical protein
MLTGGRTLQGALIVNIFLEAFILLPVTESYTSFNVNTGQAVAVDTSRRKPSVGGVLRRTERHSVLEAVKRQDTFTNQQKYTELSHLLQTVEQKRSV